MDELVWRERRRDQERMKRVVAPAAAIALAVVAAVGAWMYATRDTSQDTSRPAAAAQTDTVTPRPREAWVRNLPAVPLPPPEPPRPVRKPAPPPPVPVVAKTVKPTRVAPATVPRATDVAPRQNFFVDVSPDTGDPTIYTINDGDVVPPVASAPNQLGRLPRGVRREDIAAIEVVVNRKGTVESVRAQLRPQTLADAAVITMSLSAAKAWHFRPATKDGEPVKYRKVIPVTVR